MTVKSLAVVAAVAVAWGYLPLAGDGFPAAGVTSAAPGTPAVQLAMFFTPSPASGRYPQPQAPAADVPSPDELLGLLNTLADPSIPAAGKSGLIEDGLDPVESGVMDRRMQRAAQSGKFPLSFTVNNITPAGRGAATADITASGPQLEPRTVNIRFVDQGGWKLSRSSMMALSQMTSGS